MMLLAVASFSGMDALLKLFSSHYSPLQVGAMRGAASLPIMLAVIVVTRRTRDLVPVRIGLHVLRGLLSVIMFVGFIYGVRVLSLADTYSIFLSAPLLIAALSAPLLGDRVGWRRWLAIGTGLIGVYVILRPSPSNILQLGAVAIFVSALAYALSAIMVRVLARTDTAWSTIFWQLALLTTFAGALAAPQWEPIRSEHLAWLLGVGVFGAAGQVFITAAFRSAPPSVVAPLEYTALLWGIAIDWFFWEVLPSSRVYVGGGIVIASGLYLIWRERVAQLLQSAPH